MSILTSLKKLFFTSSNGKKSKDQKNQQENQENINVYDCMVPLSDLVVVDITASFETLLDQMKYNIKNMENDEYKPANFALIYHETTDDLVGIVYSKDIIYRLKFHSKKDGCDFLFSPIIFAPINMGIGHALDMMNKKNSNVLMVVDNKGGTLGAVTKNSIIDYVYNYEETQEYFTKYVKDNKITVDGTLLLKYIPEDWYLKEYNDCYVSGTRTLGGFLGYHTGMIPPKNTEIIVNNFIFKVIEGNERFVKTILISRIDNGKH